MNQNPSPAEVRLLIENALARLTAPGAADARTAPRSIDLAVGALRAAIGAFDLLERELEVATDPSGDAPGKIVRLQTELERTRQRNRELETELRLAREELDIEIKLHGEEEKRARVLEQKVRSFDAVLLGDEGAFDRFMQKALDEEERKRRPRR